MKILIVEDDPILNQNISKALTAEGFFVERIYDGLLARKRLQQQDFDCIVLDVNLPGINGFKLAEFYRTFNKVTPIIMLTAFSELEDKIQGFDCGADDYLTKPFYMRELVLRITSLIKRAQNSSHPTDQNDVLIFNDITLNTNTKKVHRQQQLINLTPREFQILKKLMTQQGELVSKATLVDEIWGNAIGTNTNTIEVYINFLRKKIDKPFEKNSIQTKIGYGYYLS
ncbi:MAG: response regulator transcription factor [Psychroflexus sp.]|nr:response regulator transcription factor [Psychroflexus sp.]MDN6309888.1 response regulator transcription factor [Psychroflexus sp.]